MCVSYADSGGGLWEAGIHWIDAYIPKNIEGAYDDSGSMCVSEPWYFWLASVSEPLLSPTEGRTRA